MNSAGVDEKFMDTVYMLHPELLPGYTLKNYRLLRSRKAFPDQYRRILRYYRNADAASLADMLLYAGSEVLHRGARKPAPPAAKQCQGLYDRGPVADEARCLAEVDAAAAERPVVGLLCHWYTLSLKDTAHIDALMERLRTLGAVPLCAYSQIAPEEDSNFSGARETLERYFLKGGEPRIDCLLNLVSFSVTLLSRPAAGVPEAGDRAFTTLGLPVLQVMTTPYGYEEWIRAPSGLPAAYLSSAVFQPEYDGQIITFPAAYTQEETLEGEQRQRLMPLEDRVDKAARLALGWARLRRTPNREKRVAFILHNMPPRNDTIGGAMGLDTPQSLWRILEGLRQRGYTTGAPFRDGEEIIRRIIAGLTNDGRWDSPGRMPEKSAATVSAARYREWFAAFPGQVQGKLREQWGPPPGEILTAQGKALIPGLLNGNIFIGLQPPRGFTEKAEDLVHSPGVVCPHQYLAFYRWISRDFGAHAVIHLGTHGTLEWLPGKEVGLGEGCYPDLAIDTLPNLYPYIISNPGEGVQAKRRSYCALVDHLIPSMVEGGTYEALADLDDMMKEYYHFKLTDRARAALTAERILTLAEEQRITGDIGLSAGDLAADIEAAVDRIHAWTSRISRQEIRDGLHIFGKTPEGERLRNLLRLLLRVRNGEVPSLREGLCAAAGLDPESLLEEPARLLDGGRLGNSDRVIGLDLISPEELGRPRIDVTLRITGLFRDTFPNLIERIEEAVNRIASLDEDPGVNYVKKHIGEDMAEFLKRGESRKGAFERAALRIFGDAPGAYGAGVAELVESRRWNTPADLGRIYTEWGGYAYGKGRHGERRQEDFARRLSRTDLSIKNEPSVESDMLGSDDFYNYFGGMVSAVSLHAGEMKPAFIPNTADRDRPELFSLHEEASRIMRARINNPRWIAGLKPHGYRGAQEVSEMVDIVFGWDAVSSVIDDWMYGAIADRYVFNEETSRWLREVNLRALQNISARLLEAAARGMWKAPEETLERLHAVYIEVEGEIEGLY
ncbi:MAG: cobaltochelatase subunit CobN [Spirochaetaceae bacterium]|jgi:cobalamin biosynthesis Mg chelatase CobN|nr:cobaltochelatase subunit CobN [Spirochaetaceae bacterium]